jgi:hypothetical protein
LKTALLRWVIVMGKCVIFVHAQAFFEGSAALPVDLKKSEGLAKTTYYRMSALRNESDHY